MLAPGGRAVFAVWELELADGAALRLLLEGSGFGADGVLSAVRSR